MARQIEQNGRHYRQQRRYLARYASSGSGVDRKDDPVRLTHLQFFWRKSLGAPGELSYQLALGDNG